MNTAFARLVWKDAILVRPLVVVVAVVAICLNLLLVIAYWSAMMWIPDSMVMVYVLWNLLPSLIAFGVPAMLIGTEEENGTLSWLRTLGMARRDIVLSKLCVGISALVLAWVISTFVLQIVLFVISTPIDLSVGDVRDFGLAVFVTCQLLLIGYITSYLFRSPIAALVAVLPPMIVIAFVDGWLMSFQGSIWHWSLMIAGSSILLIIIQYRIAMRRLNPTLSSSLQKAIGLLPERMIQMSAQNSAEAFGWKLELRLPKPKMLRATTVSKWNVKPTPSRALLWQAATQQLPVIIPLLCVAFIARVIISMVHRTDFGLPFLVILILTMCWIGCMAFYPDTLRRRHLFFAERGLSMNSLWASRVAIPIFAVLLMLGAFWKLNNSENDSIFAGIGIVAAASGLISAMLVTRPVLAFFIGPAITVAACMTTAMLLNVLMEGGFFWVLFAIPVLFSTWRLQSRWANGRLGIGYFARAAGYLALGVLVVCVYVFAERYETTPAAIPQWRETMYAEALPSITPSTKIDPLTSVTTATAMEQSFREAEYELNSHLNLTGHYYAEKMQAVIDLLILIRTAREAVVRGELDPSFVFDHIERAENLAFIQLSGLPDHELQLGVAELSSDSLRRKSRRIALIHEWKRYQQQSWNGNKYFAGRTVASYRRQYALERLRADRIIDVATRDTLAWLDQNNRLKSVLELNRLKDLWGEVIDGDYRRGTFLFSTDSDQTIDWWRSQFPSKSE